MASAAGAATSGAGSTAASVSFDAGSLDALSLDALSLVAAALKGCQGEQISLHLDATFSIPGMADCRGGYPHSLACLPCPRLCGTVARAVGIVGSLGSRLPCCLLWLGSVSADARAPEPEFIDYL